MATDGPGEFIRGLFLQCVGSEDGEFGIDHLRQVLQSLGADELSEVELGDLMTTLDQDDDGKVSLEDFQSVMSEYLVTGLPTASSKGGANLLSPGRQRLGSTGSAAASDGSVSPGRSLIHNISVTSFTSEEDPEWVGVRTKLLDVMTRGGMSDTDQTALLERLQAYVDSQMDVDDRFLDAKARYEQAERKCEQLRGDYALLGDEFQKLEKEIQEVPRLRRQLEETCTEYSKLQRELQQYESESGTAVETENTLLESMKQLKEKGETQQKVMKKQGSDLQDMEAQLQNIELDRSKLLTKLENLERERDSLLLECTQMSDLVKESEISSQSREDRSLQLEHDNQLLHMNVDELRMSLTAKEEAVDRLQASLTEQTTLVQTLRGRYSNGDGFRKGSIMDELEEIIAGRMGQMADGDGGANTTALLALLTKSGTLQVPPAARAGSGNDSGGGGGGETLADIESEDRRQNDKAADYLRLYAASTQHLSGRKIVTREEAEEMDLEGLEKLSATMIDLIRARNKRLLEALDERDRLQHEISVKKEIITPVISLVRMGQVDTPKYGGGLSDSRSSTPAGSRYGTPHGTPRASVSGGAGAGAATGTPQRRGLGGRFESPASSSTSSPTSARKIMTRLRFWAGDDSKRGTRGTEVKV